MKSLESLTQLYVATFNRAPDTQGILYWLNYSSLTLDEIAISFFEQDETKALYPEGTSNTSFISDVYQNLFNREPDSQGLSYWEAELDSGSVPRSSFIMAMINGAQAASEKGAQQDFNTLSNKKALGLYFVEQEQSDVTLAKNAMSEITHEEQSLVNARYAVWEFVNTSKDDGLDSIRDLASYYRSSASDLYIESGDPYSLGFDNYAYHFSEDRSFLGDVFKIDLLEDRYYTIVSGSNEDPEQLILYDRDGQAVAYDHTALNINNDVTDVIEIYKPEYSGRYYIDASWEQSFIEPVGLVLVNELM